MKVTERDKTIIGDIDSCIVREMPSGRISVGNILLNKEEALQFLDCLRQAFSEMGLLTNTGHPRWSFRHWLIMNTLLPVSFRLSPLPSVCAAAALGAARRGALTL